MFLGAKTVLYFDHDNGYKIIKTLKFGKSCLSVKRWFILVYMQMASQSTWV